MGSKHKCTAAEREERRRRDRERLAEATRALLSSEGWQAWLSARHAAWLLLRNTLLIAQKDVGAALRRATRIQVVAEAGPLRQEG